MKAAVIFIVPGANFICDFNSALGGDDAIRPTARRRTVCLRVDGQLFGCILQWPVRRSDKPKACREDPFSLSRARRQVWLKGFSENALANSRLI